jgi:hypothetical protein
MASVLPSAMMERYAPQMGGIEFASWRPSRFFDVRQASYRTTRRLVHCQATIAIADMHALRDALSSPRKIEQVALTSQTRRNPGRAAELGKIFISLIQNVEVQK